jgi:predicted SAM-dependent methyltransferase
MHTGIRHLLSIFLPVNLVNEVIDETHLSLRYYRSWPFNRAKYRGKTGLKLNIGCGPNAVSGWVNVDAAFRRPDTFCWDCRRSLPFDDSSVSMIFAEHVFEHFDEPSAARFLSECRRCLAPGGILRLVVPDAGMYLSLYNKDWSGLVAARPLVQEGDEYRDQWLDKRYRTKMELINAVFRQYHEHKYAYDAETILLRLRDAGFSQYIHQSFAISSGSEPPMDTPKRQTESLYVEGIK